MAKENWVMLLGPLYGGISLTDNTDQVKFTQTVIRRNSRVDHVPVNGYDQVRTKMERMADHPDPWVLTRGIVTTRLVQKRTTCSHCGHLIEFKGNRTEILAIDVQRVGIADTSLEDLMDFSNQVFLLGSLVSDVEYLETPMGIRKATYKLGVNRKYKSPYQLEQSSDYPTIQSYDAQADSDMMHLQHRFDEATQTKIRSQCFISGGLQVNEVTNEIICPHCRYESGELIGQNTRLRIREQELVVVTNSVEYLNNCVF